jgi:hypothetical protein
MAVSSAQAQSLLRPGQSILFSAPDGGETTSNMPSLAAQPLAPSFEDAVHAPDFDYKSSTLKIQRLPPPSSPRISADEADRRANWALMTPAEILGVDTAEQELKIPKRDAAGRPENPTAVERFYERQNQPQTNSASTFLSGTPSLGGDFQDGEAGRVNANVFSPSGAGFGAGFGNQSQSADTFEQPAPGAPASQNNDGGWSKIFISQSPKPVQSAAQAANMAEFRKLLEPSQPSKSSSVSSDDGLFSAPQVPAFGRPANLPGSSGQLNNGIGGLPSLPGTGGQSALPTVTVAPDWKPQLPPWMLRGPQPDVIPKRVVF